MRRGLWFVGCTLAVGAACKSGGGGSGGGGDTVVTPSTYVATGGEGDLSVWTIADGGADVTAVITAIDVNGAPVDGGQYTVRGSCSARDTTFDYRTCTVSSVDPTRPGGKSPKTGDQYYTLELPGVAFLAHPAGSDKKRHDLHVGVIGGTCGDLSGTYNMVHVGPPGFVSETFGQFTLVSTTSGVITGVTHWDYGYVVNGQYSTNSKNDPIKVAITTGDSPTVTLVDGGSSCASGVASIAIAAGAGEPEQKIRVNVTQQGALLADLQKGNGGVIGLKASTAASIDDLKNRILYAVVYEGGADIEILRVQVDGDAGVTLLASTDSQSNADIDGGKNEGRLVALSDSSLASHFGSSAIVDSLNRDGGIVDGGWVDTYGGLTAAHAGAPAPSSFPGFFTLVNSQGQPWESDGRMVVLMVQKADAGLFFAGGHLAVNNPSSGMDSDGGFTRCFNLPQDAGYDNAGMKNNRQHYCVDGPFVGYSR